MEHSEVIVGTCMSMCPREEMLMREKEELLHPLEAVESDHHVSLQLETNRRTSFVKSPRKPLLRADPQRAVKEYSRSAAGRCDLDPHNVRPASVLKHTMLHLLNNVATLETSSWNEVYDFVFDRIRAVRQDMTIQGIVGRDAITILEQTVRFHAYASYRLRSCGLSEFDPVINRYHLLECLKELLCLYKTTTDGGGPHEHPHRAEFEAIYLCDNLGNSEAISHCLSLPRHIRNHPLVQRCLRASVCVLLRNYARALRLIHTLACPTCLCVVSNHLDKIRIGYLQILSHGYSVKNCQFPVSKLSSLLYISQSDGNNVGNDVGNDVGVYYADTHMETDDTDTDTDADIQAQHTSTTQLCSSCHLIDWFSNTDDASMKHIAFNKAKFTWPSESRPCPSFPILDKALRSSSLSNILVSGGVTERESGGRYNGVGVTERHQRGGSSEEENLSSSNSQTGDGGVDGIVDRLCFVSLSDRQSGGEGGGGGGGGGGGTGKIKGVQKRMMKREGSGKEGIRVRESFGDFNGDGYGREEGRGAGGAGGLREERRDGGGGDGVKEGVVNVSKGRGRGRGRKIKEGAGGCEMRVGSGRGGVREGGIENDCCRRGKGGRGGGGGRGMDERKGVREAGVQGVEGGKAVQVRGERREGKEEERVTGGGGGGGGGTRTDDIIIVCEDGADVETISTSTPRGRGRGRRKRGARKEEEGRMGGGVVGIVMKDKTSSCSSSNCSDAVRIEKKEEKKEKKKGEGVRMRGRGLDDEKNDGQKMKEEKKEEEEEEEEKEGETTGSSWEHWSESEFSKEMDERLKNF